jgi:precorrin-6B methylase 2
MPQRFIWKPLLYLIMGLLVWSPVLAQERFSLFVPTTQWDVERMVKMAELRDGDVVFDLGSGDGRIVMEAVRKHPGVRGRGIEINEKLVIESREKAQAEGIADRVEFLHQNAFDADLSEATVIVMWLFPELMRLLRTKILREARPGTRVITRTWDLGSWPPDAVMKDASSPVYKWVVPARLEGNWSWVLDLGGTRPRYSAVMEQQFQKAEGVVRVGNRRGIFENVALTGEDLSFTLAMTIDGVGLVRHEYQGRVGRNTIEGKVRITPEGQDQATELPWRAERVWRSRFFAPTGVDIH